MESRGNTPIRPDRYERKVPVMAAEQHEDLRVVVPYLRQFNNCSLVLVQVESPRLGPHQLIQIGLDVDGYACQCLGGFGAVGYRIAEFVVTPIIPDARIQSLDMTIHVETDTMRMAALGVEPTPNAIPRTRIRVHGSRQNG